MKIDTISRKLSEEVDLLKSPGSTAIKTMNSVWCGEGVEQTL